MRTFCTSERGYSEGRAGHAYNAGCPDPANFLAGYQRGRELYDLGRRRDEVEKEIGRIKAALKEGIASPRARAEQIERLETLTRESEQLELRIRQAEGR